MGRLSFKVSFGGPSLKTIRVLHVLPLVGSRVRRNTYHTDSFHREKHGPEKQRQRGHGANGFPVLERWRLPEYVVEYAHEARHGQGVGDRRER